MIADNIKRFYKQGDIDYVYFLVEDGKLRKIKATNGTLVWTSASLGTNYNYGLAVDPSGYIYAGGYGGVVKKIDPSDGSFIWSKDLGDIVFGIYCDSNGYVYVGCIGGWAYRLNPSNGDIIWTSADLGVNLRAICCDENYVYVALKYAPIERLSISDGTTEPSSFANFPALNPRGSAVNIGSSSNKISFGGNTSTLRIYDTGDDSNIDVSVGDHILGIRAYGDYIYITRNDGYVRKIDATDGSIKWTSSQIYSNTCGLGISMNEDLYVGGRDGKIRKLDSSDGSVIWTSSSYQATTYEFVFATSYCSSWGL